MNKDSSFSAALRFLIGTAALGLVLTMLNQYAAFINQLVIAVILAIVFTPMMRWLRKMGAPVWLSLTATMTAVIVAIAALLLFFIISLAQLGLAIPQYAAGMEEFADVAIETIDALGLEQEDSGSIFEQIDFGQVTAYIKGFITGIVGTFSNIMMIVIVLAFLLVGEADFNKRAQTLVEQGHTGLERMLNFGGHIWRYVIITNNLGMIVAAINTAVLFMLGIDFALLWGVLSWLLSYVPIIGFAVALIPPTMLALLQYGWLKAALVVGLYLLINFSVDNIIKPRIMGDGLDIAPVLVFVSIVFWTMILGPLGGILSIPATLAVKELVLEADPASMWIAQLIGGGSDGDEA